MSPMISPGHGETYKKSSALALFKLLPFDSSELLVETKLKYVGWIERCSSYKISEVNLQMKQKEERKRSQNNNSRVRNLDPTTLVRSVS